MPGRDQRPGHLQLTDRRRSRTGAAQSPRSFPDMADTAAGTRSTPRKSVLATLEIDTRLLGMIAAFIVICVVFNVMTGGRFLTPRNLFNLTIQTASVADHGDGHGLHHRDAPHRPLCRRDPRRLLGRDGDGADGLPARGARLRPWLPADALDRDPCRPLRRRRDRRGQRLARRLPGHPVVHRHARRPPDLAPRRLVHPPTARPSGRSIRCS